MKRFIPSLILALIAAAAVTIAPAAAATKLAGDWTINGKFVSPTDTPANATVDSLPPMDLTIFATSDPKLFAGAFTGPDNDKNYITIMMDSGSNMHFTISVDDPDLMNPSGKLTRTTGRGTASNNKIVGYWSDDIGKTGVFTMTRKR